ncbi:hypothetical protein, partial [Escherichia coli]|uniref:hypothetical protein n=1 Tax=Escherichia coli TaxID=562 RepID=UPI001BFD1453
YNIATKADIDTGVTMANFTKISKNSRDSCACLMYTSPSPQYSGAHRAPSTAFYTHLLDHGAVLYHVCRLVIAFYGAFKSWHRFRFIFFKATTPLLSSMKLSSP